MSPTIATGAMMSASPTSAVSPTPIATESNEAGWLESARFDTLFIVWVAALALVSGLIVVANPSLLVPVILADLWLLGYHHVIATYTRLTFDGESFREHRFMVLVLPWLVLAGTVAAAYFIGTWLVATVYLYWQWFHYTRQSYGIARVYMKKADATPEQTNLAIWSMYLVPAFGILYRSIQPGATFLTMPVKKLPVLLHEFLHIPQPLAYSGLQIATAIAAVLAFLSLGGWALTQLTALRTSPKQSALALYLVSHHLIFLAGYFFIDNIDHGWLVINIWHNAQYILFVWWFNAKKFDKGVSTKQYFLSWLSQKSMLNIACYFGFTLVLSTAVYLAIILLMGMPPLAAIPAASIVTFQAINFHHYIVDGLIWKVRKKKIQTAMGLAAEVAH
ncbi:MAG: hypothetical protein R3C18_10105 [Planctomycetaceae bacterium]